MRPKTFGASALTHLPTRPGEAWVLLPQTQIWHVIDDLDGQHLARPYVARSARSLRSALAADCRSSSTSRDCTSSARKRGPGSKSSVRRIACRGHRTLHLTTSCHQRGTGRSTAAGTRLDPCPSTRADTRRRVSSRSWPPLSGSRAEMCRCRIGRRTRTSRRP
jgi:hypothetical protein